MKGGEGTPSPPTRPSRVRVKSCGGRSMANRIAGRQAAAQSPRVDDGDGGKGRERAPAPALATLVTLSTPTALTFMSQGGGRLASLRLGAEKVRGDKGMGNGERSRR